VSDLNFRHRFLYYHRPFHVNPSTVIRLHTIFLPNYFQSIIHQLLYCSKLYNIRVPRAAYGCSLSLPRSTAHGGVHVWWTVMEQTKDYRNMHFDSDVYLEKWKLSKYFFNKK